MLFADRQAAGLALGEALRRHAAERPVVLALPRGGVPVASEIARVLGAPLDVLLVRKIGVPGQEELALGAVVEGVPPRTVVNDDVASMVHAPAGYLEAQARLQFGEIERRRILYRGGRGPPDVRGRTVIVVDDGIATGATARAALRELRGARAARVILAVPVAPREVLSDLAGECDELVCLQTPEPFVAVGAHYQRFEQTSDAEVARLLARYGERRGLPRAGA